MTDEVAASRDVYFPGFQDFQLHSSDDYTFHLSRQVLTQASGYFADMFAMGSSSQPRSIPFRTPCSALPMQGMVYPPHPYHLLPHSLPYAASLRNTRCTQCANTCFQFSSVDGHCVIPFVKTHPIPSLVLLIFNGSRLGIQASMQECI